MTVEQKLQQDLHECESQIVQMRSEIQSIEGQIRPLMERRAYIRSVLEVKSPDPNQQQLLEVKPTTVNQGGLTMVQMAVEILTQAGGRLKMEEIVSRMISGRYREAPTQEDRKKLRANISSVISAESREVNPRIMKSKKRGFYKLPNFQASDQRGEKKALADMTARENILGSEQKQIGG